MSLVIFIRWRSKNGFSLLWKRLRRNDSLKIGIFTDIFWAMCFGIGREGKIDEEFYNKILLIEMSSIFITIFRVYQYRDTGIYSFSKMLCFLSFYKMF